MVMFELCEARRKFIWVETHGRLYDPSSWRDRKTLLEDAIKSEADSAETSDRVTRRLSNAARQGRPHGRPGFGFAREYDPKTGRLVRQVLVPAEATLGAELYERLEYGCRSDRCVLINKDDLDRLAEPMLLGLQVGW
jgi:site-specific DNA recombinase